MLQTGIDVMILTGPARLHVVEAVHRHAGVARQYIAAADERHPLVMDGDAPERWAVIHTFDHGDVSFKLDLNARHPMDFATMAQQLAQALGSAVAWPDEGSASPADFIHCEADGTRRACILHDVSGSDGELLGFSVRRPPPEMNR